LLNALQAFFSCATASIYLCIRRRKAPATGGFLSRLGLDVLTPLGCDRALVARGKRSVSGPRGFSKFVSPLVQQYLLVSALQSFASWLSIVALRHLSFPAITLAKSSKLVPVLIMNVLLYRRHFANYKYFVVMLVTVGVYMFMALGRKKAHKASSGNSAVGMTLLAIHLLIDGATNSTQDEIFATYGPLVSGTQMMLVMNAVSFSYMSTALLVPEGLLSYMISHMRMFVASLLHPHWLAHVLMDGIAGPPQLIMTPQIVSGVQFLLRHPDAFRDVIAYGLAGAAGQIAIFETLERFGSLTLVSITVRDARAFANFRLHAKCSLCFFLFLSTTIISNLCSGLVWPLCSLACSSKCGRSSVRRPRRGPRRSRKHAISFTFIQSEGCIISRVSYCAHRP